MSYILTYTGKHFEPLNGEESLLCIEDIAHALSLLCRGNGHMIHFYSVAQHAINCAKEAKARGLSERLQFACLLHDAAEAYLSDVTRPIKEQLTWYQEKETALLHLIWKHFLCEPLTEDEEQQVFAIDDAMLSYEFQHLMADGINDAYKEVVSKPLLDEVSPSVTEGIFLERFQMFLERMKGESAQNESK